VASDVVLYTAPCTFQGSHASRKVVEFKNGIFQAWKVMENDWSWKSYKSYGGGVMEFFN